ncbi:MAG: hypothetical protein U5L09_09155 [Bacteroidales bacterium]|nr:hypothetical protein [Bacteroidales bacterium]
MNQPENWWINFAQNKRLCNVIANYFGWQTKYVSFNGETLCLIKTKSEWVSVPHISYGGLTQYYNLSEVFDKEGLQNVRWQVRGIIPFSEYYRANKVTNYLRLSNDEEKQFLSFHLLSAEKSDEQGNLA